MKKRIFAFILIALMVTLSACTGKQTETTNASNTQVIKVAFNQPETHPQYKAMEHFGEQIFERTNGAYKIELYPNELLGPQRETVELVQTGAVGMSIVANSLVENFNKKFSILGLPYIYDSKDHQNAVFTDDAIVGELFKSTADKGFTVLTAFHAGVRNVYTNKPINTPDDLKGLKIRIMESDTNVKMMRYMGGVGTPMAQSEVYTATQSGVIDGGENNELIYAHMKHYEVAKYYSYTQHLMIPDLLIINQDIYNGMSEEHRAIFDEEIKNATVLELDLWEVDAEIAKKTAEENGAEFVYPDIKLFQENVKPLHEELTQDPEFKELYDNIRAKAEIIKN
ncbi:TRAP transporter substrate-binding protein [Clostridium formicaceticum]|uniref:C4-dicarboxylate ABC transporter substrate-binding protein n=1 Tax=Clostridium formicaceticum TaxID=1497 RepID=A0AAC9RMC1_9CLOT|nr:TRAP transporter substrate-binding protein [Clostridium formicaceticum]AOY77647.1 C4-dicarboxylate ABC transporter substrate-binding protein [Clostridium formicaceticum]ARE88232.1 Sialic acid-binding periplasmic protein SiaP precursor [Clostridium formicaceticum]